MRRRLVTLAIVMAAVFAQALGSLGAAAFQEDSGEALEDVEVTELGRGKNIKLYDLIFDPGESIPQRRIPEPLLIEAEGGPFVFYVPEAAGDTISFRGGERPYAVDSTDCDLPVDSPRVCTFNDVESSTPLDCVDNSTDQGGPSFECRVSDSVGIFVPEGTTVVLAGPTECMICKLDQNAGELEVAAAIGSGDSTLVDGLTIQEASADRATPEESSPSTEDSSPVADSSAPVIDPCKGGVR